MTIRRFPGHIYQECRVPKFGWLTRLWLCRVPVESRDEGGVRD